MAFRSIFLKKSIKLKGFSGIQKLKKNTKVVLNNKFLGYRYLKKTNIIETVPSNNFSFIYGFLTKPRLVSLKFKRFLIARSKKVSKNKIKSIFWVRTGNKIFLFKKALNSRMGKGGGSYYSSKRLFYGCCEIFNFKSNRSNSVLQFKRYISSRLNDGLVIFLKKGDNFKNIWDYNYICKKNLKKKTTLIQKIKTRKLKIPLKNKKPIDLWRKFFKKVRYKGEKSNFFFSKLFYNGFKIKFFKKIFIKITKKKNYLNLNNFIKSIKSNSTVNYKLTLHKKKICNYVKIYRYLQLKNNKNIFTKNKLFDKFVIVTK